MARNTGYSDCLCCGETIIDADLCDSCTEAECEACDDEDSVMFGMYVDCQIPRCPHCDTEASFLDDKQWHSNCDAPCENADRSWGTV